LKLKLNTKAETLGKNIGKIIISRIREDLLHYNQNYMHVFCGPTGSGKSYCALSFACALDPDFDTDNIVFDAKSFIKLVRTAKRATAIVFDEAGVEASSRDWYSERNKALMAVSETFRFRNLAVFWTTPNFGNVDKRIRELFHFYSKSIGIDFDNKIALMTYEQIDVERKNTGKIFFRPVRIYLKNGTREIKWLGFRLPPKRILEEYEKMKNEYFENLLNNLERKLSELDENSDDGRSQSQNDVHYIAELVLKNPQRYIICKNNKVKVDDGMIMSDFGISPWQARMVRKIVLARVRAGEVDVSICVS